MLKMLRNPTVQIPQWTLFEQHSPSDDSDGSSDLADPPTEVYSCDEFRMYEFKVRRCARGRAHDWTDCPYAHPGEKARRRDPRRFQYSGSPCPEFKKGEGCEKGESCEFAHGVFECWLHPSRYRTQPCKDGTACRRRVCFFAHTPDQLRLLTPTTRSGPTITHNHHHHLDSYDGSPVRIMRPGNTLNTTTHNALATTPTSVLSQPVSPDGLAMMMMRKMRLNGFSSSLPATPKKMSGGIDDDCFIGNSDYNNDGIFDGLDVGWISELVK